MWEKSPKLKPLPPIGYDETLMNKAAEIIARYINSMGFSTKQ